MDRSTTLSRMPLIGREEELTTFQEALRGRIEGKGEVVGEMLVGLSKDRPLLFIIDDIHWAGSDTAEMLKSVTRATADCPVMFAVAYTDQELSDGHPIQAALVEMQRQLSTRLLDGPALSRRETVMFLRRMRSLNLSPASVEGIWRASGGNPLVLRELLLDAAARPDGSGEAQLPEIQPKIPSSTAFEIRARAARLQKETQALLSAAATFPGVFLLEAVGWIAGLSEEDLLDAIDEALETEFVRPAGALDRYDFGQAVVRRALREELNPSRLARLHQKAAESLESLFSDDQDEYSSDLAQLYGEARELSTGNARKALEWASVAGDGLGVDFVQSMRPPLMLELEGGKGGRVCELATGS